MVRDSNPFAKLACEFGSCRVNVLLFTAGAFSVCRSTYSNKGQLWNTLLPILHPSVPSHLIPEKPVWSKAKSFISFTLLDRIKSPLKFQHCKKALFPILSTSGMLMEVRLKQRLKASSWTLFTEAGIVMSFKSPQKQNMASGTVVMLSCRIASVRL